MSHFESFFDKHDGIGQQLLWEHTIHQVMILFREAEKRVRSPEGRSLYPKLDGWWRKSPHKIKGKGTFKVPEETAVSEALIEEMRKVKRELMLSARRLGPEFQDIDLLEITGEVPRRQKKGIGRKSKPTDFLFYRSGLGDVEFRVEAKIVLTQSDIAKHYLAAHGIGRFSDPNEPYTDEVVGGMVAYTMTESRADWDKSIRAGLQAAAITEFLHPVTSMGESLLCSSVPYTHQKSPPQREVMVVHLVLELDCDPSAR